MSFGVSLCLFRLEISNEFPLLENLKYTAPKYRRGMASAGSFGEGPASCESRGQRGRRELRALRVETTVLSATPATSSCSSKEQTPQPDVPSEGEGESGGAASTSAKVNPEVVPFVSGNPFVEVTKGILHLYKENELTSLEPEAQRSEQVCLLAVPASLSCQDLLAFTAACHEDMRHLRIIRPDDSAASPNQYMALIEFRSQQAADEFYQTFHGIPYSSLSEEELCHVAFVSGVEVVREGCGAPPPGHTELPTCPVCLERMDESVDGILTILCNHAFHSSCLAKWGDATCPVCRYVQTPEAVADNRCFECLSSESLWICLICGHVGCGRYVQGHASQHFVETQHCYSMQLGNNRVWDYVGDNFVHRLLQNKEDGKMVALGADQEGRTLDKPPGSEEKVDSLQLEFTYLLTSQLESQRLYFEDKMVRLEQDMLAEREELRDSLRCVTEENQRLKKQLDGLRKEKNAQEKKVQQLSGKLSAAQSELQQEASMSRGLQQNQGAWQEKFAALESKFTEYRVSKDKELGEVKEQLRDVMFYLGAQSQISESEHRDEIAGGHIVVPEAPSPTPGGAAGGKQRRRKHR